MSWLHIARIAGLDGAGAWLVVPGVDDYLFTCALESGSRSHAPIRRLSTLGGWLVPDASEAALWEAIAATHGPAMVCEPCLNGDVPCEAWARLVTRHFEAAAMAEEAHRRAVAASYALPTSAPWYETPPRTRVRTTWEQPTERPRRAPPAPPPPAPPSREVRLAGAARLLGVRLPASRADVVRAFRRVVMKAHPDLGGSSQMFIDVIKARDELLGAAA